MSVDEMVNYHRYANANGNGVLGGKYNNYERNMAFHSDDDMLHIAEDDPMSVKKRKIQKPNSNEDLKDWSEDEIFTLIREWESIENLYNVHHPKYPLRDERKRSLLLLKDQLQSCGINVTAAQIQKKMISLKNHFNSERRKVEASASTATKNDSGSVGSLYTPKWQYYRHLLFLRRNMTPSESSDNGIHLPTSRTYSASPEIETDVKYPFNPITVPPSSINVPTIVQTPPATPALSSNSSHAEDPAKENGFRPPLLTKDNTSKSHHHNNTDSFLTPNTDLLHLHQPSNKKLKDKTEDEIFGDMIVKMLSKIPDSEDKYMLKMRLQQDIMRTMFITRYPSGPVMSPPTSPSLFNSYMNSTRGHNIAANYCTN